MLHPLYKNRMTNFMLVFFLLASVIIASAQDYIEELQNVDQSLSGTYQQSWSITKKAPYLIFNGKPDEMQVQWQLSTTSECTIDWGTDTTYSTGTAQTDEYGSDHQHQYFISDLQPAVKYFYRVTAGTDIHTGNFRSAPSDTVNAIKFIAYGDTRSYPADHNEVAKKIIAEINADEQLQTVLISVGDLVRYGDNESDWTDQFFNPAYPNIINMLSRLPYQSSRGNHEQSAVLFQKYFPYPFISGRYWSFDYGPLHFVMVDQYTTYSTGSAQLNWIENDLATTDKPWKFIVLHEPGWSAGGHENEGPVQTLLQPLCIKYNVPIVFGGHNHYYARAVVNDIHHITTGGGGAPIYSANPNYPYIVATKQVHHYCKIEIENDILNFSATDVNGNIIDEFTTNKYGIIPHNVSVSKPFIPLGQDSLLILSKVKNPQNHHIQMMALLNAKSHTFKDSVELFDDGLHGDGDAIDGIWGNYTGLFSTEDQFVVDMAVSDLDSGMYYVAPQMTRFTTIGPVVFNKYKIVSSDTIPNHMNKLKFEFTLQNNGLSTAATQVTSQIVPLDSFSIVSTIITSQYGDIQAGAAEAGKEKQYIKFDLGSHDSVKVKFRIDISSDQYLFRSDTFSVFVYKVPDNITTDKGNLPEKFSLSQNYPNPFNPTTVIQYQLPAPGYIDLSIYNILGQKVSTLVSEKQPAGYYKVQWDATGFTSGMYLYKLETQRGFIQTRKFILLK